MEAINNIIESRVHTCIPGIVNKYDPSGPTVEATIAIKKELEDGTILEAPMVVAVPVIFPRTNRCHITFPLEKGDGVLLLFSERSIEEYCQNGTVNAPQDLRRFDITDAVAIPGFFGFKKGSTIEDGTKLEVVFDSAKLVSDGTNFEFTGDIKVNGKLETTGDILANGISVDNHKHAAGTIIGTNLTYINAAGTPTLVTGSTESPS